MAAIVLVHLVYNKLRFDSWLDFGLGRQLSTMKFRTAPGYLLPNVYSYLLRPLKSDCWFPFLNAPAGLQQKAFPAGFQMPRGYNAVEPVAGLLNATPWVLLAAVAAGLVVAMLRRARRTPELGVADRRTRATLWCGAVFLVLGTVTGLPEIAEFFASMRFLADVAAGLVLAGVWAAFALYAQVRDRRWPGAIATAVIVGLGGASIAIGLLLGVEGYDHFFERENPELFGRAVRALSLC
jgi:MFS family permease